MFRDTYEAELDYLYQLCEELGRAEPTVAPVLGRGADPSVARLVEGLAFAFARLRQRLDDDLPEVIHPILESLCPELLCPVPSATVVGLAPTGGKMLSRTLVPAGSAFASRPVDGVTCQFQSSVDIEVAPWTLARVEAAGSTLRLELTPLPGVELAAALPARLRLFFAHPLPAALEARRLLLAHTAAVTARVPTADTRVPLDRPVPWRATRPVGRLPIAAAFLDLRDYFVFPHGAAFVEIGGIDRLRALGGKADRVVVEIDLDVPIPRGVIFDPSTVVLHAVPARNVFRPPDFRVPLLGDKQRCTVVVPDVPDAQVHTVREVALVNRGLQKLALEPWAQFFDRRHDDGARARYEIRRAPALVGDGVDVGLRLTGSPWRPEDQLAVEVSLLATNGARAAGLGLGDVAVRAAASPPLVNFGNLTPVTRPLAPPLADDATWQAYRVLRASLATLTRDLGAVLALANLPARARWPGAKPDAKSFAPLLGVRRERSHGTVRDELRAGARLFVALDPTRFDGPGDVRLFGEHLAPLFAATLHPRHHVELTLVDGAGTTLVELPRLEGTRLGL